MSDLIDRQKALSVTWNALNVGDACKELRALPAVEPSVKCIAEIKISRDDLKQLVAEKVDEIKASITEPEISCSEIPNSSDLISRQAAIAEFDCCELTPDGGIDVNYAIDFLKQMPPAEPERKPGRWIDGSIPTYAACSECGYQERYADENNYCPNCGARMNRGPNPMETVKAPTMPTGRTLG